VAQLKYARPQNAAEVVVAGSRYGQCAHRQALGKNKWNLKILGNPGEAAGI